MPYPRRSWLGLGGDDCTPFDSPASYVSRHCSSKNEPRLINPVDQVGLRVSQAPASSTSSMALPISSRRGRCHPRSLNTTSASTTDASGSRPGFGKCYNFRGGYAEILVYIFVLINLLHCRQTTISTTSTTVNMLAYVNRLFAERYKQWKSDLSLLRRIVRRSLKIGKKIECGSVVIFRSQTVCGVQNSWRLMSLQTFMFDPGMSWLSPFILSGGGRGRIVRGWGMLDNGNLEPLHPSNRRVR
ncbi:hypothetical protein D8674_041490 [Pyrus ussuriensis x Pyrus communis]|uniref:Uncharacterized protein n=1 Tax=Pyrus ussuriensis x Pyrus communis TaxID=2448454 RepID=A0A5N5G3N6_9ROSA|nr:hypothetical protein D8674_041490 [Pyrus ussuriensis x Pyrus communis]